MHIKGNGKKCSNYRTIALIFYTSKEMLKTSQASNALQARVQQYVNQERPDVQAGRQRNQKSNYQHPLDHKEGKGISEKHISFCFIDYTKAFDCVDHNKLENF